METDPQTISAYLVYLSQHTPVEEQGPHSDLALVRCWPPGRGHGGHCSPTCQPVLGLGGETGKGLLAGLGWRPPVIHRSCRWVRCLLSWGSGGAPPACRSTHVQGFSGPRPLTPPPGACGVGAVPPSLLGCHRSRGPTGLGSQQLPVALFLRAGRGPAGCGTLHHHVPPLCQALLQQHVRRGAERSALHLLPLRAAHAQEQGGRGSL